MYASSEKVTTMSAIDLVLEAAYREPNVVAIVQNDQQWTYGDLLAEASHLACKLRSREVSPEVPVAICLPRSSELVLAQLAIALADGAFLPLDPTSPPERLRTLVTVARPPVVISCSTHASLFGDLAHVEVLDQVVPGIRSLSTTRPQRCSHTQQLAYLIYTSGSTGYPKAVQVSQQNLLNLIYWHQEQFSLHARDRIGLIAGPAFDASVWEIWPALASGASLYIPEETIRLQPARLWQWLNEQKITITFVPTPLAELLLQEPGPPPASLRWLLTGGDQLHCYARSGHPFRLVNNYGPTEAAVVATSGVINEQGHGLPDLGYPISGTQVYLVNEAGEQVAEGEIGEIYIGGLGVARGYRGQPALTAGRFIPHPWTEQKGERLYRTGDLARYRKGGAIEFVGRADTQVKLRGYRIELGEIEATLRHHPGVREAVVVVQSFNNQPHLVAFVTLTEDFVASPRTILTWLKERLPFYMIPTTLMPLTHIPLTLNGKFDRRAMSLPEDKWFAYTELIQPRNALEEALLTIWKGVLEIDALGVIDNFFAMGGHSLLALKVVARVQKLFKVKMPVQTLFTAPTIAEFAEALLLQEPQPGFFERISTLLRRVTSMSPEQIQEVLQEQRSRR